MDKNDELFKGTSFADLMSDVYHNSKKKDRQINQLISQLQPLIRNASDATIIVPLIKEYLDVAVKNDDHLVKLTAIVQRYISTKQTISGADGLISDEEKQELLRIAEKTMSAELEEEIDNIAQEDKILTQKIADVKQKLTKDISD
jgi:chromosome segregation ATPase